MQLDNSYNHKEYLRWKRRNVTFRGMVEVGKSNSGGASFGEGLYTAFLSNKSMAKGYGNVYFVVNAIPKKNPKTFYGRNEAEIFVQQIVTNFCNKHNVPRSISFFDENTTIADEMMALGYDGLIIRGREMVNYTPPENVRYFKTEGELIDYYKYNVMQMESFKKVIKNKLLESLNK